MSHSDGDRRLASPRASGRPQQCFASEFVGLSKGAQGRPVQSTLAAADLSRRGALQGVEAGGERLHRACAMRAVLQVGTRPHRRRGGVAGRAHLVSRSTEWTERAVDILKRVGLELAEMSDAVAMSGHQLQDELGVEL